MLEGARNDKMLCRRDLTFHSPLSKLQQQPVEGIHRPALSREVRRHSVVGKFVQFASTRCNFVNVQFLQDTSGGDEASTISLKARFIITS